MNKTSTIKEVNGVKEWNGGNGKVYYHDLTMENGDKINMGVKSALKVGDELTYYFTDDVGQQEFTKAKKPKIEFQQNQPSQGKQTYSGGNNNTNNIMYQVILKGVMDYFSAHEPMIFNAENINQLTTSIFMQAKSNLKQINEQYKD
jgi:hypothetical protein